MSEYIKKTWKKGEVITAEALNNIEAGIAEAKKENEAHGQNEKNPHGVTPAQIGAVPTTRTVNGKALDADIELSASDIGAVSKNCTINGISLEGRVELSAGSVGAVGLHRGAYLPSSINMDELLEPGNYYVNGSNSIANLPYTAGSSIITVREGGYAGSIIQKQICSGSEYSAEYKRRWNGSEWSEWHTSIRSVNGKTSAKTSGEITLEANDFTCYTEGSVTAIEKVTVTSSKLQKNAFAKVCFLQLAMKTTEALSANEAISVVKVSDGFVPSRIQALSCYSPTGSIDACINTSGNIRLRPTGEIKTDAYIYVQGFWFL